MPAMGMATCVAAAPASTSTSRISSVAYAVDEMASDEKTASATFFESRSCCSSAVAMGRPSIARLKPPTSDVTR